MNIYEKINSLLLKVIFTTFIFATVSMKADVITDWNIIARDIVVESKLYTPPANRVMAIVHTAVYETVNSITHEYPQSAYTLDTNDAISIDAAVASANYTSLKMLIPKQHSCIEKVYLNALNKLPNSPGKTAGINLGKSVAEAVVAAHSNDGSKALDSYRPFTSAGQYVPTVIPAVPHWGKRQTWVLENASQFRPGPPPALDSEEWARDLNEVKELGAMASKQRSKEQSEIARFWEATLPPIYHGVVHSVALLKGRTVTQNARLFAMVTQASDDALVAVFDAKYHYGFWRPITAIRNADADGNDSTSRDENWKPFIPTPMHPEYPCAHCIVASTVGTILKAEIGNDPAPILTTNSVTANGASRSWPSVAEFVQEVSDARIYDGVHYRTSAEVGTSMGVQIGKLAIKKYSQDSD